MTDVSAGFRPPCWCPSRWAPAWRLQTNLYKFGKNVSQHIFHKKNCCDLNLGESLNTSTFFLFPDSRLNLLNGFIFILIYLEWRDTENHHFFFSSQMLFPPRSLIQCTKVVTFLLSFLSFLIFIISISFLMASGPLLTY